MAQLVVERTGRGDGRTVPREQLGQQILGARLAFASCVREDFLRVRAPVIGCQRLVGLQRISRTQKCEIVRNIARPVEINERACSAGFCTGFDKIVAFKIFSA